MLGRKNDDSYVTCVSLDSKVLYFWLLKSTLEGLSAPDGVSHSIVHNKNVNYAKEVTTHMPLAKYINK